MTVVISAQKVIRLFGVFTAADQYSDGGFVLSIR